MNIRFLMVAPALLLGSVLWAQSPAHADLMDATGKTVGTATLAAMGGGVHITANLSGLPPGTHALHIHTVGKCEGPGFTTAGGHFNPEMKKHGLDNENGPHAGDMPNFTVAGKKGKADAT